MATSASRFPQRPLVLGTLWFPVAFLVLWACATLGWWSSHHMGAAFAVCFAAIFLFAVALQSKFVLRAIAVLREQAEMRLPLNYILLVMGVLTVILAAGFAVLFGIIAVTG